MRCVWLTWALLTSLSAILCGCGCLLPYWIKGSFVHDLKEHLSDIGLFRRCTYPVRVGTGPDENSLKIIAGCGHYFFEDVPHLYWKVCLMMLSISTAILVFLTFLLFILGFCVDILKLSKVYKSCQAMQFVAGVLVLLSCILYPLGWRNNYEVSQICGKTASLLSLGRCNVGWAFVLTCAGGLIALLGTTIPALLLRNGCMDIPQCNDFSNQCEVASVPSTMRESMLMRYGTTPLGGTLAGTTSHSFRAVPQHHLMTNGTRYSYVSYQSLLASSLQGAASTTGNGGNSIYGSQQQQQQLQHLQQPQQQYCRLPVPQTLYPPGQTLPNLHTDTASLASASSASPRSPGRCLDSSNLETVPDEDRLLPGDDELKDDGSGSKTRHRENDAIE